MKIKTYLQGKAPSLKLPTSKCQEGKGTHD